MLILVKEMLAAMSLGAFALTALTWADVLTRLG